VQGGGRTFKICLSYYRPADLCSGLKDFDFKDARFKKSLNNDTVTHA
jgi:hypothetical protein